MLPLLLLLLSGVLVFIDQISKHLAVAFLKDGPVFSLIPKVFELRYSENTGVAFSLLENQRWLFIPVTVLVAIVFIVLLFRSPLRKYKTFTAACVLILAGGIGNLIDRVWHGYVIDFIYFRLINFPIFNLADCCVVIGAAFLFVFVLFIYKEPEDTGVRTWLFGMPNKEKEQPHGED
ncbi:MAG: signal peptidase II [Clostridia bacterium]|nr:signal peptidase II [Clostridia bacterium]